ncbi:MAG: PAS domain S-box protein, partial [Desulfovibrionales bacterium]
MPGASEKNTASRLRNKSISLNLTLSLFGLVLLLELLLLGFFYSKQADFLRHDVQDKADQYISWLSEILAVPLWEFDDEQVRKIGLGFAQNDLVDFIVILDPQGSTLFATPAASGDTETLQRSRPIDYRGQPLGRVDLTLTLGPLKQELGRLRNLVLLALAGSLAVIFIATGLLLRVFMRQPLNLLERGMDKITRSDFDYDPRDVPYIELRGIAERFGSMAQEIQSRETSLQAMNSNLQQQVLERRRAEAALQQSEAHYRLLFEELGDAIFVVDRQGRILNANQQACAVLGYSREELLNLDSFELDPSLEDADALEHFWNRLKLKTSLSFESRHKRKDGSTFPVELRIALLELEDQEVALATARDISDRKQAEQEKALLEEQLRQAQKMEAVGKLAGGIAHDFNNLLQALSGKIQLMLHSSAHRLTQTQYFLELDRITQRASRLVTQLLTFSRRSSPELQEVDLNQEIQETLGLLERTIPKMISLETDLSPSIGKFLADPMQIEQVLMNLISNAVDALPRGGEISVSTSRVELDAPDHATLQPGPYARLCVADNGLGMEQDVLEHIFEPFFTTKPIGQGTGLGLSSVYGIVKNHGGEITCSSSPGRGSLFTVLLPLNRQETPPGEKPHDPDPGSRLFGKETILVVDDEEDIRAVADDLFTSYGYTVLLADTGEKALEVLGKEEVDLVLLDLGMPGMGGQRCLEEIVKTAPATRVIIASGYTTHDIVKDPAAH